MFSIKVNPVSSDSRRFEIQTVVEHWWILFDVRRTRHIYTKTFDIWTIQHRVMSSTQGTKRSRSEEPAGKIRLDPDLVCAVCTELVLGARQAQCCGNVYCKDCIEEWLLKSRAKTCPSCRSELEISKLLVDKRTDRQSANHLRNCKYFDPHGCAFIGTRSDVLEHQRSCSFNPEICKNPYCRTLHALEVARLRNTQPDQDLSHKRDILACAWKTPEDILKSLYDLQLIDFFEVKGPGCDGVHKLALNYGQERYTCVIECAHHNVSITCVASTPVSSNRCLRFVLIHPTDPSLNESVEITIPRVRPESKRGNLHWMTEETFRAFVKDGKLAFGTKSIPCVTVD